MTQTREQALEAAMQDMQFCLDGTVGREFAAFIPGTLARIRAALALPPDPVREAAHDMLAVLRAVEWSGGDYADDRRCPYCLGEKNNERPHARNCILRAAIARATGKEG